LIPLIHQTVRPLPSSSCIYRLWRQSQHAHSLFFPSLAFAPTPRESSKANIVLVFSALAYPFHSIFSFFCLCAQFPRLSGAETLFPRLSCKSANASFFLCLPQSLRRVPLHSAFLFLAQSEDIHTQIVLLLVTLRSNLLPPPSVRRWTHLISLSALSKVLLPPFPPRACFSFDFIWFISFCFALFLFFLSYVEYFPTP